MQNGDVPWVADDLGAWLVGLLADAGRKKLTTLILGTEQERVLRSAATAAVQRTAEELRPGDEAQAGQLAMVVSEVFGEPVPGAPLAGHPTVLETLQAGIAGQIAVLDDASLTGMGRSSAEVLGLSAATLADRLTEYLVREIVVRGSRGGPLEPLAAQLNHDVTHLQGQRLEGMVGQLASQVREALSWLDVDQPTSLEIRDSLPQDIAAFTGRDKELDRIRLAVAEAAGTGGVVAIHAIDGMPRGREDRPGCARRSSAERPVPGQAAVHRPARLHPWAGSDAPRGGAGRVTNCRRGGRPLSAPGSRGPSCSVAGPDGWPAGAACPRQRCQQRPGHPLAAPRWRFPGASH